MRDIFIPFTIDKRFWNKNMPNVFLNKVYEQQLDEKDGGIQYNTILTSHYQNAQRCKRIIVDLSTTIGRLLNQYHGLDESTEFWYKMLFFWLKAYVCSIRFKIDQMNNLRKQYPDDYYSYYTYASDSWKKFDLLALEDNHIGIFFEESYHFVSYLWLAEKFFNVQLKELNIKIKQENQKTNNNEFIIDLLRNIRDGVINLTSFFPSRMKVGTYEAQEGRFSWIKWYLGSSGAIRRLLIPSVRCDSPIDLNFRNNLKDLILNSLEISKEEKMIVDFLPKVFPRFFVEDFRLQYDVANAYLKRHPNLSVIFTSTATIKKSSQKICMLLLQKRGGKILGQQHGGNHQITLHPQENARELELDDIFYYWGKSALSYQHDDYPHCRISFAPSYKLYQYDKELFLKWGMRNVGDAGTFLFVGTSVEAYPRPYAYGIVDKEVEEYIEHKFRFLSALGDKAKAKMIVREYPVDYGWHMSMKIKSQFPELKISTRGAFNKLLSQCSLYISDHLATTWLEAIFLGKPCVFILLDHALSIQNYDFRREEKEYLGLLREAGIILYSPEEAAELVNYLADYGVGKWWMDDNRQKVIQTVKERWITKVDDIDEWWCHELLNQCC